jgi:hypothetical protein
MRSPWRSHPPAKRRTGAISEHREVGTAGERDDCNDANIAEAVAVRGDATATDVVAAEDRFVGRRRHELGRGSKQCPDATGDSRDLRDMGKGVRTDACFLDVLPDAPNLARCGPEHRPTCHGDQAADVVIVEKGGDHRPSSGKDARDGVFWKLRELADWISQLSPSR